MLQVAAAGPGVRDAGESRRRFLSIDTPLHQHSPAATTTCLDARVAPSLCQGHHLSTAHAAHAAPAVVMRDAFCFFACQTQEHTARSKKGADTLTPAFSPLAVARRPASNRSANSGEGALKRFPIRYRHRAEQEVVQTAASYSQLQLSAFSPASLLKWQLERVVSGSSGRHQTANAGSWSCHGLPGVSLSSWRRPEAETTATLPILAKCPLTLCGEWGGLNYLPAR